MLTLFIFRLFPTKQKILSTPLLINIVRNKQSTIGVSRGGESGGPDPPFPGPPPFNL